MNRDIVEIIPYQKVWQEQFELAKADLERALGDTCTCIEHIGSTSVQNLASKDRVDIQVGVREISQEICNVINAKTKELGLPDAFLSSDHLPPGENTEHEWKKIYLQGISSRWDFKANIHIRKVDAKNYQYALLFRDYLRHHPESALAYARLKLALAKHTSFDRDAYCEVKDPACDLIMINARDWLAGQNGLFER